MKATFDVTVKIDGTKVDMIFSMRDGVEDMDIEVIDKVTKAATNFASMIKGEFIEPPGLLNIREYAQILDFVQGFNVFTTR